MCHRFNPELETIENATIMAFPIVSHVHSVVEEVTETLTPFTDCICAK